MNTDNVRKLYVESTAHVRGKFGQNAAGASKHYSRYIAFVMAHVPCASARILDVGCGNGWSTYFLQASGHRAEGCDLHNGPLEVHDFAPSLRYTCADAQKLPFGNNVFDVVCMHAVLEHIPNPMEALAEATRVLSPNGRLVIVGPHLLSIGVATRCLAVESSKALIGKSHWVRTPTMPRHPFGNTVPEVYWHFGHHMWMTWKKLFDKRPVDFLMREPDLLPPFHADNDSCYYCNPIDIVRWARQSSDVRPIRWWAMDRFASRLSWFMAGGTWVVLEKTPRDTSY